LINSLFEQPRYNEYTEVAHTEINNETEHAIDVMVYPEWGVKNDPGVP
jgi:hypothetical protein